MVFLDRGCLSDLGKLTVDILVLSRSKAVQQCIIELYPYRITIVIFKPIIPLYSISFKVDDKVSTMESSVFGDDGSNVRPNKARNLSSMRDSDASNLASIEPRDAIVCASRSKIPMSLSCHW
ncbi:hypothetical protein GW17_00053624, partial [Ensete ventricosum]